MSARNRFLWLQGPTLNPEGQHTRNRQSCVNQGRPLCETAETVKPGDEFGFCTPFYNAGNEAGRLWLEVYDVDTGELLLDYSPTQVFDPGYGVYLLVVGRTERTLHLRFDAGHLADARRIKDEERYGDVPTEVPWWEEWWAPIALGVGAVAVAVPVGCAVYRAEEAKPRT